MPTKTKSKPPKSHPRILDDSAASLLAQLRAAKEVRTTAEKIESDLKDKVKDHMIRYQGEFGTNHFFVASNNPSDRTVWDLNLSESAGNPIIKSEKLLERGVAADIISYATNRTPYVQVLLKKVGEE